MVKKGIKNRVAFFGAALETFNLIFLRYALQILVSLDSPTIARAAAGLAAFAAAMFCPKILLMALNILSVVRKCQGRPSNFLILPT